MLLDTERAEQLAYQSVAAQQDTPGITAINAAATPQRITVVIEGQVNLGLLGLFADGPLEITVTAVGRPNAPLPPP